ncbi:cupin [Streptomyces eurythermus]|uniref:cupin n=1 Tax=Streptomyces eurythermus TaxID=42237 RepID=UPI0036A70DE2
MVTGPRPRLPGPLPGAVGLSHAGAYDWEATDGVRGDSPHTHLVRTEAYVVTGGGGAAQTLSPDDYRDICLRPGAVAWFTPGTVHGKVRGGGPRVTVLMRNSGLPEAGDAAFTFPPEALADPERYAAAATLPPGTGPRTEAAARRRRDLAVEGFPGLRETLAAGDAGPCRDFRRAAARPVRAEVPRRRELWRAGAPATAERTGARLDALETGEPAYLGDATAYQAAPTRLAGSGMCGHRDEYALPGTTLPYDGPGEPRPSGRGREPAGP